MKNVKETLALGLVAWLGAVLYGLVMVCAIIAMLLVLHATPEKKRPVKVTCKPPIASFMHGGAGQMRLAECVRPPLI
jgi:hypothetical protein